MGPETLGAVLAEKAVLTYRQRHVKQLELECDFFAAVGEKDNKTFSWRASGSGDEVRRNHPLAAYQSLWFDDLMTSGSTWNRTRHFLEGIKQRAVKAVVTIVNRSNMTAADLGVSDFIFLEEVSIQSHEADECPDCELKKAIVTNIGYGGEFQKKYPDYEGGFKTLEQESL